jgi:hypothetical protein
VDQDSVIVIATHYELSGPGIICRGGGGDFSHPSIPALWPTRLQYNGYRVSFPRVKRPGRGVDYPPPSSKGKGKAIPDVTARAIWRAVRRLR